MATKTDPEPLAGGNLPFVEALYAEYLADPSAVGEDWRSYFAALDAASGQQVSARHAVPGPSFRPASIFSPPGGVAATVGDGDFAPPQLPPAVLEERLRFLRGVKLVQRLPAEELALLAAVAVEERFADGTVLMREGEVGDFLYLVIAGHLVAQRGEHVLATIGPGDVVGELAVLDEQPRSADVVAHDDVRVLRLDRGTLFGLIERRPALARGLIEMLAGRMRRRGSRQDKVNQLIHHYRVRGHLKAQLDPLGQPRPDVRELELEHWGLAESDLDSLFSTTGIAGTTVLTLREILALLRATYCGYVGVQFMHIDDVEPKRWLLERLEDTRLHRKLEREEQLRILTKLTDAEILEQFIHSKFLGAKRFSLEGAETLIPLLDLAFEEAGAQGVDEIVIGMAHRGRLNVLVNTLGKSPRQVFREFADQDSERFFGRGDVKYHLGHSSEHTTAGGHRLGLSLCFNPSHLEFVNPVAVGRVRAKQVRSGDLEHRRAMAILIHGDAAISGQGVNQELFNMSDLEGYRVGGTVHIVVNNQIGFTTPPESGRSTKYATDVARMLQTPIFHVNGENPDAVAHVVRLAMDYRREFQQDVIIDMYCYRRHGHNEGDEPAYTQPLLYEVIRKRKTVREGYLDNLLKLGGVSREEAEEIERRRREHLEEELSQSRAADFELRPPSIGEDLWRPYRGGRDSDVPEVETGVPRELLATLLRSSTTIPKGFHRHRKLAKLVKQRLEMAEGKRELDWGSAEAAAFASLLMEGAPVRLTGQDTQRGTFSHRHAVFHDVEDGSEHVPLAHLTSGQGRFEIYDSPLSEVAVVGFEYGYSLEMPNGLVAWEAQFGDFSNVAQVIIDQFLSSSEDKWGRLSGLTMLLPHGFEGQGPEHSSARLERFLTLAAEDNLQVVNPTTPAQYFHLLRRQVLRPFRKPLVVMSPKKLLRLPAASSPLEELVEGRFHRVLADPTAPDPQGVRKVVLTSGKLYYDLVEARGERRDVALVRLEQYYPLRLAELAAAVERYPAEATLVWAQEEPRNMGAWSFLRMQLEDHELGRRLRGVSRIASASPATGSSTAHKKEQEALLAEALA